MAKKLYVGNYRFDASEREVYVKGNVTAERFLVITNITRNTIIYNFADPNVGYAGVSYSTTTDETTLSLVYDTTSMLDADILQIFVQGDYQEITPAEDILDPVGKLRVSNPENLIDTDFEYGLQGTKWETIQTVNNIPTIYSSSGDTPIDGILEVEAISGSKNIKVTTSIPHGLAIGDPISVQGVSQYQAQGYFIVTNVPNTTTFYFELDVVASFNGDISGSYTTIVPGKFFEGSTLPISIADGAVTDGNDPSTISVTTAETHGFSQGTKVYIRNTVGPRTLQIADSAATAPDGRPYVDSTPQFNFNNAIAMSTATGRGGAKERPVCTFDWESTYQTYLIPSNIDTANNRITWNGHNLRDSYALIFQNPYYGQSDAGLVDGGVYYVNVVDSNTIELHTTTALNSIVNLSTLNNTYGLCRLSLCYKVESASGTTRKTPMGIFVESAATGVPSNYVSSTGTAPVVTNLALPSTITSPSVTIQYLEIAGDTNSSGEYVEITIGSTTQQIYGGNQSSTFFQAINSPNGGSTPFDGLDISSLITGTPGNYSLSITHSCHPTVGTFVSGLNGDRYRVRLVVQQSGTTYTEAEKSRSGGDLIDFEYGLGGSNPSNIIAFQGRTFNSYNNTFDGFSFLSNQNDYGRYGTIAVRNPSYSLTAAPSRNGNFSLNYSNSNQNYGTTSEIFYVFCNPISADRNTIYIQNHGITENTSVTVKVNSTNYSAGQRFSFTNTTGGPFDQSDQFTATASAVNDDVIRIQTTASPQTDDIVRVPENFTIEYGILNTKYNSIYVSNHKITGEVEATYTNVTGNAITPLVSGSTYNLNRLDDSRLTISGSGQAQTGSASAEYGNSSNAATTQFINIETPLGFEPSTATIDSIEFRGDFSSGSEYVDIAIRDSSNSTDVYTERIGANDDSGDTSQWTTSTTFSNGLDISSYIVDLGGNKGFYIRMDPSAQVNFSPSGMPNGYWWQLRFNFTGQDTGLVLTSSGTLSHTFDVESVVGAYDGVFNISSVPTASSFTLTGDFKIPIREYEFTTANVNTGSNTIAFADPHNLTTGEKVTYDENGNTSILPAGTTDIFVVVINSVTIRLSSSALDAASNVAVNLTSPSGNHFIRSSNIIKSIAGSGTVNTVSGSKKITGTNTNFLSLFKRFDKIYIDTGTYVRESVVDSVTTNTSMTIFDNATTTTTNNTYYYLSQIALRPDGYNLHKPFDGGVDITAGTSPNGRIARQTRKYFRYQSGKGLQTSFAINFNPPKLVKNLIKAVGSTATVDTQEQHNLSVGDIIKIAGATVSSGTNYYNGTFTVATTPSEFQFTYTMSGTPNDIRAGGFPTYVRESWTDSFVRGGMFDDQNGFFYEYDGQELYAVRRSSTKQIAGDINVTRDSQVVTGEGTSFTSQLQTGHYIVIRGQSYLVTEISSDIRCVIQPAYRGISGVRVKATKTVDTRTPQSQWNIDKADGTGFTGYILDTTKIQMAYMDYSWYGAGKIRYGFKDAIGHIRYFHEYRHNNLLDESYFRSGNLPARYEIANGPNSSTSPTLFHFGTSIIMDGNFDDDKAYQFTGQSRPFAFTDGGSSVISSTANSEFAQITLDGNRVYVYDFQISQADAQTLEVGMPVSVTGLPDDLYITQINIDGATSQVFINYPATTADPTGGSEYSVILSGASLTIGETTAIPLQRPIPLISVRLAPSVDSGLTGALGEREVINRMQLRLRQASVTTNSDIEIFLIQNTLPSVINYVKAQSPSLSQIIKHAAGDTLIAGTTIYSAKVSAGSVTVSLEDLLEIGNSVLGGDGIFPAGPDLLTLAVQTQAPRQSFASPFTVSGNISWSESQA